MADSKHQPPKTVQSGTVRMQEPASHRGRRTRRSSGTEVVKEIIQVEGFMNFLREHTVVTLAVGFAIATQAQTVIKQLIASFIDPLYGLLFNQKLSDKVFTLHFNGHTQQFAWGQFVYTFIDFIFVLLAIYWIVKAFNLDKLEKTVTKEEEKK